MLNYDEFEELENAKKSLPKKSVEKPNKYTEEDLEDWKKWAEEWVEKKKEN
tara:strand:+ start:452 stop:604 length:153 start_codon:yes stop_codon:yes gene_type:complete